MNGDGRREREEQLTQYAAENPRPLYQTIYELAATFREVGASAVQTILHRQNADSSSQPPSTQHSLSSCC